MASIWHSSKGKYIWSYKDTKPDRGGECVLMQRQAGEGRRIGTETECTPVKKDGSHIFYDKWEVNCAKKGLNVKKVSHIFSIFVHIFLEFSFYMNPIYDPEILCFVSGLSGWCMCLRVKKGGCSSGKSCRRSWRRGSLVEAQLAESVAGQISWQSV